MSNTPGNGEWIEQWRRFSDEEAFLFEEWIKPLTLKSLRGKRVLECGCGGGHHTRILAEFAEHVTAVDLECIPLARERCKGFDNVSFVEADLVTMNLKTAFDVVLCVGVIHHTESPDKTFKTILDHLRPGGELVVWTYSSEGNSLVRYIVEPIRKLFIRHLPRSAVDLISRFLAIVLYPIVHTVYRLPLRWLPYWEYFQNFRRLSFERNVLNVYDKLNAPQTQFTTKETAHLWMGQGRFVPDSISIQPYKGVSWTLYGVKSQGEQG